MNKAHLEICSSPEWARQVEEELLPWVLAGCELGDDLLEVGPGPGLTTDVLRRKAGSDGLDTPARREAHEDDVFVPVDPATLEARLLAAGFARARVDVAGDRLKFAATTAAPA